MDMESTQSFEIDPESGLEIRWTDNGVKPDDPEQLAPEVAVPLELDADGEPVLLGEVG